MKKSDSITLCWRSQLVCCGSRPCSLPAQPGLCTLVAVVSGTGRFQREISPAPQDGQPAQSELDLHTGEALLCPPSSRSVFTPSSGGACLALLGLDLPDPFYLCARLASPLPISDAGRQAVLLDDLANARFPLERPAIQNAAGQFYQMLLQSIGDTSDLPSSQLAERIRCYLETEYASPLTMEILEQKFHRSRAHLGRVFTAAYHQSPMEYLCGVRLGRARMLLEHNRYAVHEIARMVGFANSAYFIQTFRKRYGAPPLQWRKQYLAQKKQTGGL